MNFKLLLFIIPLVLLSLSCKKDPPDIIVPIEPTNCEYPAGNRNFSWRLDTVAWWPSWMGGIHAFSDSDAYVMGYVVEGIPPYGLFLGRHWNGETWEENINGTASQIAHNALDVTGDDNFMVSVGYWGDPGVKGALGEFNNLTKKWKGYQFQTPGQLRTVWTDSKGYFIAAGDNGMVYTKDGYDAEWVYQKVPSDFSFIKIEGVSKSELYALADSSTTDRFYQQVWKYWNGRWLKLSDNYDTLNTIIKLPVNEDIYGLSVFRCSVSDSLYLYLVGYRSYEFSTKGSSLEFHKTNLESKGLPFSSLNKSAINVRAFSPNDLWITATGYNIYHWNGMNYTKIQPVSGLPYGQSIGGGIRIIKNTSGKIWMVFHTTPQVYIVLQGNPY